ncbi:unnamed protein product, partial [marine sediment metagenome]
SAIGLINAKGVTFGPIVIKDYDGTDAIYQIGCRDIRYTSEVQIVNNQPSTDDLSGFHLANDTNTYAHTLRIDSTRHVYFLKITPSAVNSTEYSTTVNLPSGGIEATYDSDGDATVAEICAGMVSDINGTAVLTDSVEAEDSTTFYVIKYALSDQVFASQFTTTVDVNQDTVSLVASSSTGIFLDATVDTWIDRAYLSEHDFALFINAGSGQHIGYLESDNSLQGLRMLTLTNVSIEDTYLHDNRLGMATSSPNGPFRYERFTYSDNVTDNNGEIYNFPDVYGPLPSANVSIRID